MNLGFDGGDSQLRNLNINDDTVSVIYRTPSSNDFLYKYKLMNANEYEYNIISFLDMKYEIQKEINLFDGNISANYMSVDNISIKALENKIIEIGWEGEDTDSKPVNNPPAIILPLVDKAKEFADMKDYFSLLQVCQEYSNEHEKPVLLTVIDSFPYQNYCESYFDVILDFEYERQSVDKVFYLNIAKNRTGTTNDKVLTVEITDDISYDSSRNI